jgi:homoserine kinase
MVHLRTDEVHIRVPASSANLGSAFDCAGLGLDLWDDIYVRIVDERGIRVDVAGVGEGVLPGDCSHLVAQAMKLGFDALNVHPSGIRIRCVNHIPHGQGLGSSAAAIIGGFFAARALVVDGPSLLSDTQLLTEALALESHPDNLSGSLFGGLSIAWVDANGTAQHSTFAPHSDIDVTMCIPSTIAPTREARAALPSEIPLTDVVVNLGASAMLVYAMTVDPSFLFAATRDAIHQHRRKMCFSPSLDLMDALRSAGIPAVISGAGPAVLAFAAVEQVAAFVPDEDWHIAPMGIAQRGAHVID